MIAPAEEMTIITGAANHRSGCKRALLSLRALSRVPSLVWLGMLPSFFARTRNRKQGLLISGAHHEGICWATQSLCPHNTHSGLDQPRSNRQSGNYLVENELVIAQAANGSRAAFIFTGQHGPPCAYPP
jgi:hypothetical protein